MQQVSIAELAEKHELTPGHVNAAVAELGLSVEAGEVHADADELELLAEALAETDSSSPITIPPNRTARDLAQAFGVKDKDIQKILVTKLRVMATLTTTLQNDVAEKVAEELGWTIAWGEPVVKAKKKPAKPKGPVSTVTGRPPVVTILGHVDHGKTSLLDYIRKENVVKGEHGGITQHIGAYQVELPQGIITFLDTPGHAAFTAMRARGAHVTDIAVLVVAADDGIMPQTIEAISHVKNAGVPFIIACNKMDLPTANPDKIMQQLTEHEVVPEAYGGQVATVNVSAHTGDGVDDLLERILLEAEVAELKADPKAPAEGVVIEAKIDKGRGVVATILVEQGTLKSGDIAVVGQAYGKIRTMTDHAGNQIKEAGPSTPVELVGLSEVPEAGDRLEIVDKERTARQITGDRHHQMKVATLVAPKRKVTLRDIQGLGKETETRDLNLIVKADVKGSVEAVRGLLDQIDIDTIDVRIVHAAVGPITESDVLLASAADGICVGFNVKPEGQAKAKAEKEKVEIRTYNVIYELVEEIEAAVKGLLQPKFEEEYHGKVEIRAVFKLTKAGKVAGSHVIDGKITRNSLVRITRDDEQVFAGQMHSLKNVKEDVREMIAGQDCGLKFKDWEDFKVGDLVEAYEIVQVG
jgi:translation initiation factor IF-2